MMTKKLMYAREHFCQFMPLGKLGSKLLMKKKLDQALHKRTEEGKIPILCESLGESWSVSMNTYKIWKFGPATTPVLKTQIGSILIVLIELP